MPSIVIDMLTIIIAILLFATGCLAALLVFWYLGRKDIKEYLNGKEKK